MKKTVLITGTSGGFGADTVETLHKAGHRVFASMRDVKSTARETAEKFRAEGIDVLDLDVTSDASVDAAFADLYKKTGGKLDVLVNNAGLFFAGLSETFSPEQVRTMYEVNVFGMHRVMRAALPQMRKNKAGLVINIGSILGRVTIPFVGHYGATKHAVEAMTESYRYELSQLGIDVVLIQPGPFATNLYSAPAPPANPDRAQGYGETAELPNEIGKILGAFFQNPASPTPHEVAKEVEKLIATPDGKRPARVVVGAAFGADQADEALKPLQANLVHGFGFDKLEKLNVR
jgi:NAD(P)-dependent dehydrogenase (short-subunit alcohol dehydrogenase family)